MLTYIYLYLFIQNTRLLVKLNGRCQCIRSTLRHRAERRVVPGNTLKLGLNLFRWNWCFVSHLSRLRV